MDTRQLIARLRRIGMEPTDVEVKGAAGGLPASTIETISAFANGTGGTLLFGLDESAGFRSADGFDATRVRDALADACANKIDPPCRVPILVEEVDGAPILRLDVPELDPVDKPCYVTARGHYGGSYIRGGDGDRRLTHYEVSQLLSNRTQPTHDLELVTSANVDDLDPELVASFLKRVRNRSVVLARIVDDETLLCRLRVLDRDQDGTLRPTIAGLLSLGTYPQQFLPQLFVSFVVLPGLSLGETSPDGRRFLDNKSLDGPIPLIVDEALTFAIRNMRVGAIIRGAGREDRYDYPLEVIRELLVNALMHRDYSPMARGAQIQVELYPDRLVVRSPGGFYGQILAPNLGTPECGSTSRNATLAKILTDVPLPGRPETVCENRGTGLVSVVADLRRAGMSPPDFAGEPGRVTVTVPQHALLAPEVVSWIGSLGQPGLSDTQHLALAMMRSVGATSNAMLQAWGIDRLAAGEALKNLVDRELAVRGGSRRYATYRLVERLGASGTQPSLPWPGSDTGSQEPLASRAASQQAIPPAPGVEADLQTVLQAIRAGHVTSRAVQSHLDMPQSTVSRRIRALIDRGLIQPTRPATSSRQSYRLTSPEEN